MRIKILILFAGIFTLNLFIPRKILSCPIPVYRYALEFWDADPYSIEVFYKNSLAPHEEELVKFLREASTDSERTANLELRNINTEGNIDDLTRSYINNISPPEFPWVVLRYPRLSGINKVIWSGPLNLENVSLLINSPARESIATKLVQDVTAVWVMLESGNRNKDRDAFDLLNNELRRLEQTLVLPDLELWWNSSRDDPEANMPTINFDIVRVSRDDPKEHYLVKMLLNSEDDLRKFESEPIVFPVYGRGIALWAIVGRGINEWNIREAAEFLVGPCSCQAKLLNPGIDMLMSMNWDKFIDNVADMSIANPLSGMGDFANREEEVRRRLESATSERMGIDITKSESLATESDRLVYLDIPVKDIEKTSEKDGDQVPATEPEDETETERTEIDPYQEREIGVLDDPLPSAEETQRADEYKTKSNFTNILTIVLSSVIILVLLGGIVLYKKNIK